MWVWPQVRRRAARLRLEALWWWDFIRGPAGHRKDFPFQFEKIRSHWKVCNKGDLLLQCFKETCLSAVLENTAGAKLRLESS